MALPIYSKSEKGGFSKSVYKPNESSILPFSLEQVMFPDKIEARRSKQIITFKVDATQEYNKLSMVDWFNSTLTNIKLLEIQAIYTNNVSTSDLFVGLNLGLNINLDFDRNVNEFDENGTSSKWIDVFLDNYDTKTAWRIF